MKICYLATSNSIHSYKWIAFFKDQGYEITWVSIDKNVYEIPEGINYIEVHSKYKVVAIVKAIIAINMSSADFIHVHYLGFNGLISLFTTKVCIATAWGSDILINNRNWIKKLFVKLVLKKSVLITCDAYHLQDVLLTMGVPKCKIHMINFGIDSKRFSKKPKNQKVKDEIGFSNKLTIVSSRGFENVYDVQTLIKSMPSVLNIVPDARLVLVGRGTIKKQLEALVIALNLEKKVSFVGLIQNDDLPNLLSNMDIYVSTSLSDAGISASTAEAMTCEIPVVISDSGENDKWISDEENGFLFPVRDSGKLSLILIKLLKNEKLRVEIGKKGRQVIVERNDYHNEMNKVDVIYQNLIKNI